MANFVGIAAGRHAVLERAGWDVEARGLQGAPEVRVLIGEHAHATIRWPCASSASAPRPRCGSPPTSRGG